eukprot:4945923-Pyramimonas_sp.AAC.1
MNPQTSKYEFLALPRASSSNIPNTYYILEWLRQWKWTFTVTRAIVALMGAKMTKKRDMASDGPLFCCADTRPMARCVPATHLKR